MSNQNEEINLSNDYLKDDKQALKLKETKQKMYLGEKGEYK